MKSTPRELNIQIIGGLGLAYWNTQYDMEKDGLWGITHYLLIGPFLFSGTRLWFDIETK